MNHSLRGWRLLTATLIGLAVLAWLDQRLVNSAPLHGVRPRSATWVVSTTDLPRYWRELETGDVFRRLSTDLPRPQGMFELYVRQATGIRPTPLRWRVWLGDRFTLAHAPEGTGVSVYPGILLRLAGRLAMATGHGPDRNGVAQWGDLYYTWRGGFLVASPSRRYVEACVKNGDSGPLKSTADGQLAVEWTGPHAGYFRTEPGTGLRVAGSVNLALSDGDQPLRLSNGWPEPPLASVTARSVNDLVTLAKTADELAGNWPDWPVVRRTLTQILDPWRRVPLEPGWDRGIEEAGLAVLDVKQEDILPIPEAALALRSNTVATGTHPLAGLAAGRVSIPYEWNGQPGVCIPWLGPELAPCLSQYDRDWIVALNEPVMNRLVGNLAQGPAEPAETDVALQVSWKKLAKASQQFLVAVAKLELIPELSGQEIQFIVAPKLDALGHLGTLKLDGHMNQGRLDFQGALCRPDSVSGEPKP